MYIYEAVAVWVILVWWMVIVESFLCRRTELQLRSERWSDEVEGEHVITTLSSQSWSALCCWLWSPPVSVPWWDLPAVNMSSWMLRILSRSSTSCREHDWVSTRKLDSTGPDLNTSKTQYSSDKVESSYFRKRTGIGQKHKYKVERANFLRDHTS